MEWIEWKNGWIKWREIIKNKLAFTLVELIVVITIIAILWTIAFIAMNWYSKTARDSTRTSDMSMIRSSLELFFIDANKYPDPTELQPVTYSGWLAWNQWIFWNSTFINVDKLDKIPTDPLTGKEYAYSVLNTTQAYEIAWIMEWDGTALNNNINQASAAEKIARAKITWTYNWVSLRVNTETTTYVLAIPSIMTSIDLAVVTNRTLETIIPARELVLNDYQNLPNNYIWTAYNSNKETENADYKIISNNDMFNLVVHEWDITNLTSDILITKLQAAYSWTTLATSVTTNELFQINVATSSLEQIDAFWINFINNNLWWSAVNRIYLECNGIPHNTTKSYYSLPSVWFWISCDTVKKDFICLDWTWTDSVTSADIADYPETSCSVDDAQNCEYLTTPINHWDSVTVYSQNTIAWDNTVDECTSPWIEWTVTCNNWTNEWDISYWFFTCVKWDPTPCDANPAYPINGREYDVYPLAHDEYQTPAPTVNVLVDNWTFTYTFNALCNDWTITWTETWPVVESCDANYTITWNACEPSVCTFGSWEFWICVFWT